MFSEWVTPVAPIVKKDGSVTVNKATETDTYPRIKDRRNHFQLDLAHAYHQVVMNEESQQSPHARDCI